MLSLTGGRVRVRRGAREAVFARSLRSLACSDWGSLRARFARLHGSAMARNRVKWRNLPRSLRSLGPPALARRPRSLSARVRSSPWAGSWGKGCAIGRGIAPFTSLWPLMARFARQWLSRSPSARCWLPCPWGSALARLVLVARQGSPVRFRV